MVNIHRPTSPILEARKLGIRNIQTAIDNYDLLLDIFSQWPTVSENCPPYWPVEEEKLTETWPEEVRLMGHDGQEVILYPTTLEGTED